MNADFLTGFLKKKNNRILYIIFIIGIVLMLFSGRKTPEKEQEPSQSYSEQEELTRIISEIDGVGKAEVMVTYYGSVTSNIVYDTRVRGDETDRTAVVSDGVAVSAGESYPRVKGVVVVASGADSDKVSENIRSAVCAALGIPEYKVAVIVGS
ncbi:MAG: hypothetical protein IJ366_02290 [Clostridia bacterium]|nr:hypothetical protein [Clostridia bacterium]